MQISYVKQNNEYARESTEMYKLGVEQLTQYLTLKGVPPEKISSALQKLLPKEMPVLTRFNRMNYEDKHVEKVSLLDHFQEVRENKLIAAPTLTSYIPKEQHLSFHSSLINGRLDWRNEVKQLAFDAETRGDIDAAEYEGLLQVAIKTGSNSVSGIYGINSTAIGNRSIHSTLTSTARGATNSANIAIERLLAGNLLFTHEDSSIHYILTLLEEYRKNQQDIDTAINMSGLVLPTVEQVVSHYTAISNRYHYNHSAKLRMQDLLQRVTPYQLAFTYYAGSIWNIATLNDAFMRQFITELLQCEHGESTLPAKDAIKYIKKSADGVVGAATHLLIHELDGKGNNYYKMEESLVAKIAGVCEAIHKVLYKYINILKPLVIVSTLPPNIAYTREMPRDAIAGSDTDSNILSYMKMVQWFSGNMYPTKPNLKVLGALSVITAFVVENTLRQFSMNLGLADDDMNRIEMKSELTASSVGMARLTKTYYENCLIKEKSVMHKSKLIVKGVHLKSSNLPKAITSRATEMMEFISESLVKGEAFSLNSLLQEVMDIERSVVASVFKGERKYLRLLKINTTDSYKDKSPLKNNSGWVDFWAQEIALPASFVKLPTKLDTRTLLNQWIGTLEPEVQARVVAWIQERKRDVLPTIYIPEDIVKAVGVPAYIQSAVDVNKVVNDVCNIFYIILHSLNYAKPKDISVCEDLGYELY